MDLDPDPMDLMDLDLDLDPIHPSLTLGKVYRISRGSYIPIDVYRLCSSVPRVASQRFFGGEDLGILPVDGS